LVDRTAIRRRGIGWIALAALVLAFIVRLLWILRVQSPQDAVYSDMGGYVHRAEELLGLAPTDDPRLLAFYPWGAHTLIAAEFAVFGRHSVVGIAVVHAFVSAISAACVPLIAARVCRSRITVGVAASIAVLWHPQITYAAFFMSELWFSGAIALATWLYVRHVENRAGALGCGCAIAVATVVRPQALLTCVIATILLAPLVFHARSRRGLRRAAPRLASLVLPVVIIVGWSAARVHRLSGGHYGLISENESITRLFGMTHVGHAEATWTTPAGVRMTAWYSPSQRHPVAERNIVRFEGYIGDSEIIGRIIEQRIRSMSTTERLQLARRNVEGLVLHTYPNPEEDFARKDRRRALLQRWFRLAVIGLLPFGAIGLWLAGRRVAGVLMIAQLATMVLTAVIYSAEARYRAPYDPFIIVAAACGAEAVFRILSRARCKRASGSTTSSRF
jgi:hypothetical protein